MATTKATSTTQLSAIDRIKSEDKVGVYKLTDDISIEAPTYEQAQKFDAADSVPEKLTVWLGEETHNALNAELEKLPVHLVPVVLADLFGHFFGEDIATALTNFVEDEKKRMIDGLSSVTE